MTERQTGLLTEPQLRLLAGMTLEQEKYAARIERAVRRQTSDKVRDLVVTVSDEEIALQGRCGSYYTKQLAQHAAMGFVVSEKLVNRVEVW